MDGRFKWWLCVNIRATIYTILYWWHYNSHSKAGWNEEKKSDVWFLNHVSLQDSLYLVKKRHENSSSPPLSRSAMFLTHIFPMICFFVDFTFCSRTHILHNFQSMLSCRWLYLLTLHPISSSATLFCVPLPKSKTYSIYPISCFFES